MYVRSVIALSVVALLVGIVLAQAPTGPSPVRQTGAAPTSGVASGWRTVSSDTSPGSAGTTTSQRGADDGVGPRGGAAPPANRGARQSIARVTSGPGTLPSGQGQIWRDYDITPYTARVTTTAKPEQEIVDWILRETGYEAWHSEPMGFLSADRRALHVYHTPEMQATVSEMVDRFVNPDSESQGFSLRIISVGSPSWRAWAQRMLHPVAVQTQGVQAWLVAKEDSAMLIGELRKRTDAREHSSPQLIAPNGQSTIVALAQPRSYVRNVTARLDVWPGYEPDVGKIDEGFTMQLNPLMSLDGRTIDAIVKCSVSQVEKLVPVLVEVPTPVAPHQQTKVEVPQISRCQLHERFRWPSDQVLLISLGIVATPLPGDSTGQRMGLPLSSAPPRADLLVFVENKGKIAKAAAAPGAPPREAQLYRGRY